MTRTLVIYDNNGKIFTQITGDFITPVGLQHIITEIPEKKILVGVDVSREVHVPTFEDVPPTEIDLIRLEMARSNTEIFEAMIMFLGGEM